MKFGLFFICFATGIFANAQQSTRLSQYFFNPLLVNTASAGMHQNWAVGGGFKSMWSSIPGAPKTQFLTIDGTLMDRKIGVGFIVENDEAGLLGQKKVMANGNYRIRLSQHNWLAIGAGIGIKQHVIDGAKSTFEKNGDNAISTVYMSDVAPSSSAGVYFFNRGTTIGVSFENILRYKIDYTDVDRSITSRATSRINVLASHRIPLAKDWVLIPNVLVKYEHNNPLQIDITPMVEVRQRFKVGIGYRHKESTSLIVQNEITERFSAGYAYDFQTNGLASVTNGSHELMLRYLFLKNKSNYVNPRNF
ncbi:MAG: type IX secretion system membrane protein PorP/SprF [Bacteroidetes bacterium]|nr:type IX secretion system membrane protein PorP/SprF [Bacteroidota bacterium]